MAVGTIGAFGTEVVSYRHSTYYTPCRLTHNKRSSLFLLQWFNVAVGLGYIARQRGVQPSYRDLSVQFSKLS